MDFINTITNNDKLFKNIMIKMIDENGYVMIRIFIMSMILE